MYAIQAIGQVKVMREKRQLRVMGRVVVTKSQSAIAVEAVE
jgi:hypothetical protein